MEVLIGESDTKNITHISFGRGRYCQATLYAHVDSTVAAAVLMNIE